MAENKTNIGLQFFKGWYGKGASKNLPETTGAIIFNEEEQIIYVNGKPYGGASSVSFADNVLTITYSDGRATQTLDFNDTASATATLKVFERIDNLIGPNINVENGDGKLNYTGTNYLSEVKNGEGTVTRAAAATLVEADKRLDTAIKAVDTRIDNMDVESNTVDGTNVHVKYKQEDGIVTVESVTEDYATLNETAYVKQQGVEGQEGYVAGVNPALVVKEGDAGKLLKAGDVETIASYVDDKVQQLRDEVDSQVDDLDAEVTSTDGTNVTVKVTEVDGVITAVNVTENYATTEVSVGESGDTVFKTTDVENLATGADVQKAADFTNTRIGEEIAKLDTTADVQAVTLTDATETTGAKLVFNGVKEVDGVIAAGALTSELDLALVATSGAAKDVTTTGIGAHTTGEGEDAITTYDIEAGNVQGVLETLNKKINDLDTSSTLHLKKVNGDTEEDAETVSADGTEYKLYQGTDVVAKFNIEKDSFVREGEVVRGSLVDGVFTASETGEYFIHLTIKTTDDTKETDLYIPAESLVDAYTANNKHTEGETEVDNNVVITVDNTNNTISAVIKAAGVGTNELADGAVTFAKIAPANIQDGEEESSTLLTTKTYVDETVSTAVDGLDADFTGDNAITDEGGNVTVSLKEENGVVTKLGVDVNYATVKKNPATPAEEGKEATDTTITVTNEDNLVIGSDITTLVSFTNTRIAEEVAKLDATVTNDEGATQTETVKTTIVETDGKLTSVSSTVLGADVVYAAAHEETNAESGVTTVVPANLTATEDKGAVLGSDIAAIKQYIDDKAAAANVVVTNKTVDADGNVTTEDNDDAIVVDKTENTVTGHTDYNVRIVWSEWGTANTETTEENS